MFTVNCRNQLNKSVISQDKQIEACKYIGKECVNYLWQFPHGWDFIAKTIYLNNLDGIIRICEYNVNY